MKFTRILAIMMLAILLVGSVVPAASAVTWKEPWDFAGGYYTEDWAKHFATKKLTTSTKATMYRVRDHAYNTDSKKFEKVTSLRVRWEPRAYTTSDGSKQDVYNFDTTNRVRKNTTLRYFYPNQSLSIVGYTKVNGTWYLVDLGTTYKEGRYGWVYGGYIKFTK